MQHKGQAISYIAYDFNNRPSNRAMGQKLNSDKAAIGKRAIPAIWAIPEDPASI